MEEKKSYQILQLAEDNDGYVSVAEAKRFGIPQIYLTVGEKEGQFKKVARGLYVKRGYPIDPYYVLHFTYKKAIFSLSSCAYLHGLLPKQEEMEIYLPQNYMTNGIPGCKVRHLSPAKIGLGFRLLVSPSGRLVPSYDLERLFLDILENEERFNAKEFVSLLSSILKKGIDNEILFDYAEKMGLLSQVKLALKML